MLYLNDKFNIYSYTVYEKYQIHVYFRESRSSWDQEIRDDVIEECNKHGGVLHLYVDKASPQGNVYVKCPTISAAVASVRALHGRYFGGKLYTGEKMITYRKEIDKITLILSFLY